LINRHRHEPDSVIVVLGHKNLPVTQEQANEAGYQLEVGDIRDSDALLNIVVRHRINVVYHLASLLSGGGEKNPDLAWDINVNGLRNVLDAMCTQKENLERKHNRDMDTYYELQRNNTSTEQLDTPAPRLQQVRVFWASSIAVFGSTTPRDNTPQDTVTAPSTMYGITKVTGELLCAYYWKRHGLDVRSIRFPGLISWTEEPTNGTTDYAVAVFIEALKHGRYTCFVRPDTQLPMMYVNPCACRPSNASLSPHNTRC
jgi:nucleoside-diphosphate-sugar epimerase